jgi:hypothetical protein
MVVLLCTAIFDKSRCRPPASSGYDEITLHSSLETLNEEIVNCGLCIRLREHCTTVAAVKRRAYRDQVYWENLYPDSATPKRAS